MRFLIGIGRFVTMLVLLSSFGFSTATMADTKKPKGVIFSAEQIEGQKLAEVMGPFWTPTQAQIDELGKSLPFYVKAKALPHHTRLKGDLSEYTRQYFGYTLAGKRVIYVNAFCVHADHWETRLVIFFDGGECFFQATYDPEAGEFVRFSVNGVA